MIPNVEDVEAPIVGRFYMVPCVRLVGHDSSFNFTGDRSVWWPIVGPWHNDRELGFELDHYHYDLRFLSRRAHEWLGDERELRKFGFVASVDVPAPVARKRMMLRETPVHPGWPLAQYGGVGRAELEARHRNTVLGDHCPHRGFPRNCMARDGDALVCPGHGLRWCAKNGRLIQTTEATR